ncbi:MAG TPA: hypothetical protein ENI23_17170, partial [bacterium]|nr:hypothetical protein [bacterium]
MSNIIGNAKKILKEICEKYKYHDKDIMQGVQGERLHALDVLNWVEKIDLTASIPLKLAALFHDIERVVTPKMGGGFKGKRSGKAYLKHKKMHAQRSAEFIIPILEKNNVDSDILKNTEFLIIHHDDTGEEVEKINNPDSNYLVAADSFAFFTSVAPKLFEVEGKERVKDKIRFMVEKVPDFARILVWEHRLENETLNNLKNEIIKEYYIENNPREREYKFCPSCT